MLAKEFDQVLVAKDNQQVIDQSEIVFLSVVPSIFMDVMSKLRFKQK